MRTKTQPVKGLVANGWFRGKDSNLRSRIQSPLPYRLAIRDCLNTLPRRAPAVGWGCVTFGRWVALGLVMKNVLLAALVLVTAACGAYRFPGGGSPGDGTVSGTVFAVPCFPVAQPAAQAIPPCVYPCMPIAQPAQQTVSPCVNPCIPIAQPADQAPPKCPARPVGGGVATTCFPVESAGVAQCAGRPVPGVEIDFTSAGASARAVTDSAGHYTATLAAGTWSVHLVTSFRIISGPQQVTVVSGSTVTATYIIDSGIRVPVPQE